MSLELFFQSAFEVLEGLLHEDDEVVAVWYLMGWLHYLTKDADSARFYLEQTQSVSPRWPSQHNSNFIAINFHQEKIFAKFHHRFSFGKFLTSNFLS